MKGTARYDCWPPEREEEADTGGWMQDTPPGRRRMDGYTGRGAGWMDTGTKIQSNTIHTYSVHQLI